MSPTAQEMDRLDEFLKPSLIAVVATIARDGMPQLTPNWYVFSEGKMAISTTKERVKYRNLARDNRLAVCVYSEPRALEYATLSPESTEGGRRVSVLKRQEGAPVLLG